MMTLLLSLACIKPTPPGPSPAQQRESLRAVVFSEHAQGAPVTIQLAVQAGSATDPTGAEGLAWLTAHMLSEGGIGAESPARLDHHLAALDASLSVLVDKDLVRFTGQAPAENAQALSELMAQMLTEPAWTPAYLDVLKQRAQGLLAAPPALELLALELWVNHGHPYGHADFGRQGSLELLTLEQVQAHHRDTYLRDSIAVGISGPNEDTLAATLDQGLMALGVGRSALPQPYTRQVPDAPTLLPVEGATAAPVLGLPLEPTRDSAQWPALELALVALGQEHPEWGLSLSAPAQRRQATLVLEPGGALPEAKATLRALQDALDAGLTQEQLDAGRQAHLAWAQEQTEGPDAALVIAVETAALGLPDPLAHLPYEAVTLEQAQAALAQWVDLDGVRIVLVSDDPATLQGSLGEESGLPTVQARAPLTPQELLR